MAASNSAPLLLNVSGLSSNVEKDDIEDYFSRRKFGGGEARVLSLDYGEAVVSIKNLDSKAQYNLLTITHKMEGEVVTVTRCEDSASYTDPTTESLPQCTVVVKGLTYSDKDDAIDHLELYFSNSKKGGGEIADDGIVVMKGRAHVTFVDSKVAERVVMKSPHTVMGQELEVTLAGDEPPKQEASNLLLKNVPPGTDIDFLELYMDSVTGLSVSDDDYEILEKSGGLYIVVFKSTTGLQLDEIISRISKRKFKRQLIEAEKVVPSTSLMITNITEKKRDEDFLRLYFSNQKFSGVSEFDDIEILDDGRVIVHLCDQDSVQAVLQMKHSRLGPKVDLQAYDRFSSDDDHGSSHLEEVDHTDHIPATPIRRKVSHVMAQFVQQHQSSLDEILEQLHVQISFDIDDASEVGFIHLLPSKGSERVRKWNADCEAKLESFFKDLSYSSIPVHSQLLPKVQGTVRDTKSNTSLCVEFTKDHTTLHIAGFSEDVTKLLTEIKHIEEIELTREQCISMDKKKIAFISQATLEELREEHPDITITVNTKKNVVIINGKKEDIEEFQQSLKKIRVFSSSVSASVEVLSYLSLGDQGIISRLLEEQESAAAAAYYDEETNALYILASEKSLTTKLAKYIQTVIGSDEIKNPNLVDRIQHDNQFTILCKQLKEGHIVDIVTSPSEIQIIGHYQHISAVKKELIQHIQKEYFGKRRMEVSRGQWRFVSEHLVPQWGAITHQLKTDPQYQDVMVKFPKVTDDDPVILLEGEESLITSLFQQIATLLKSICTNDPPMLIDRPGLFQFLATSEAKFAIKGIESSVPACIECTIKPLELIEEPTADDDKKTSEICKGTTKEGKRVTLVIGDIENFKVDVIVNAANTNLSHGSGVALAISKKGGPKIQKDSEKYVKIHGRLLEGDAVLIDEVGNLPCKKIVHAVGPVWRNGTHYEDRLLKKACCKSLRLGHKYESYAFPAISSGLYKFPLDVCANTMIQAFCAWSEEFPHSALHNIYVVVHDHAAAVFTDAMKRHLNVFPQYSSPTTPSKTATMTTPVTTPGGRKHKKKKPQSSPAVTRDASDTAPMVSAPSTVSSIGQPVPIELHKGELLKQVAEVYVNTTSSDLILTNGAVSKSILNAAGQTMQDECSQFVSENGRLKPGDIAVTGPGKLPCKHIIHTAGSNYNGVSSEQELEATIQKSLRFCDKKEVSSIAFPALGAGALNFPSDVVARVMITTVQNYYQANSSGIKVVKFVIFMDSTYKEFQSFLSQHTESTSGSSLTASPGPQPVPFPQRVHTPMVTSVHQPPPTSYQPPPTSYQPPPTSFTSGNMSEVFKTGTVIVEVACGDITDDDSDVIVNTTLPELQLASGAVSKAISQKAGPSMQQDCNMYVKQYKQLEEGKVCITQAAGRLKCTKVFHVVAPSSKKSTALNLTVSTCLKEAECNKAQSIAFPAIGTGGLSYTPENAAQGMCEAIIEFAMTQPVFLQRVKIVVYQKDMHQIFVQKFVDISTGQTGQSQPNILIRCANYFINSVGSYFSGSGKDTIKSDTSRSDVYNYTASDRPSVYTPPSMPFTTQPTSGRISRADSFTQSSSVQIRVYAKSENDVSKTEDHLLQIIDQNCDSLPVDDHRIATLRPDQITRLTQKARDNHVTIEVETELSRIQVRGGRNNVQIVKAEIERILHEIDTEKLQTEATATAASLMQKKVKWQYMNEDEQYEDYEAEVNYRIEMAYQLYKRQKQISTFNFTDEGLQYQIIFDSDPMQEKDLLSGELTDVQRSDLEDMLKKAEFPSTWGDDVNKNPQTKLVQLSTSDSEYIEVKKGFETTVSRRTIVTIERIQNPTLYALYGARKRLMDQTNPVGTTNERRLYHGCGPDVVQSIYHGGFNRSFCGKNATYYGEGAYFAVNASYSAQSTYSPPDKSTGNRHIFLARVLTGEYTLGTDGLKIPPPKNPSKSTVVLFDSVVDNMNTPGMFVIFYDAQCYPEYLITFK